MENVNRVDLAAKLIDLKQNKNSIKAAFDTLVICIDATGDLSGYLEGMEGRYTLQGQQFHNYHSPELIDTLKDCVKHRVGFDELFLAADQMKLGYNQNNFERLVDSDLLKLWGDFSGSFCGDIKKVYELPGNNTIIETSVEDEKENTFYVVKYGKLESLCFNAFETALFYSMVGESYYMGMQAIHNQVNK